MALYSRERPRCHGLSRTRFLRCLGVQTLAAVLLRGQLFLHSGKVPAPGLSGALHLHGCSAYSGPTSQVLSTASRELTRAGCSVRRRAAGFGFSESKDTGRDGAKETKKASTGLVKDKREGKSKELSTSKLKDLRDKTLALRQKREAELDEYEEGRAMIAKYGPKVAVMPEKVAQRAAKRGMVIGGSFYGVMILVFAAGIFIYKTQELIIPPTLMAVVTLALLAALTE
mmetsp:Transcript_56474/g.131595  ORF Transcript_56474/g.131595 Transcript_56474/m.131595 type:complete len:228 (-) Transcript_56474:303-986(-)